MSAERIPGREGADPREAHELRDFDGKGKRTRYIIIQPNAWLKRERRGVITRAQYEAAVRLEALNEASLRITLSRSDGNGGGGYNTQSDMSNYKLDAARAKHEALKHVKFELGTSAHDALVMAVIDGYTFDLMSRKFQVNRGKVIKWTRLALSELARHFGYST
jgi:hypothetical protein